MNQVRLTKIFSFETAHALHGYDGKCKNIHGHSYKLEVTIKGKPIEDKENPKYGMVMDFGDLKKIVNSQIVDSFDHATVLNQNSPHKELGEYLQNREHHVIWVDYQPTCEGMIIDFAQRISQQLPSSITLEKLRLYETTTSFAEWIRQDNIV